jgi:hypothetical protein
MPNFGTFGPLAGGGDGLVGLTDTDFIGGVTVNGQTGLSCFDRHSKALLAVPGRATAAVHNAIVSYCSLNNAFPVLDSPEGYTAAQMVTYVTTTAALYNLSEYGAIYWPRIKVVNPNKTLYGNTDTIVVAPSGDIMGLMIALDQSKVGGVFEQPAGVEVGILTRAMGLETEEVKDYGKREQVVAKNINPISKEEDTSIFLDGSATLKSNGNWPSVGQRRGVIFVEKQCQSGLAFARHRNITDALISSCDRTVYAFLVELAKAGAFASTDPDKAFFRDFGEGLNTATPSGRIPTDASGLQQTPRYSLLLPRHASTDEAVAALTRKGIWI